MPIDAEAVALARGGQVEVAQVGDVRVAVHHRPLDVTELGGGRWMKGESVGQWQVEYDEGCRRGCD